MPQYQLNIQVKKTVWYEQDVTITANNLEDAVKRIEEDNFEFVDDVTNVIVDSPQMELFSDKMSVEQNSGDATIEIYLASSSYHDSIYTNKLGWKGMEER